MFKRILALVALVGFTTGLKAEEKSLQAQLDDLKAEVELIKHTYEPAEPVEQIKQVTEWVSPTGELFTEPQKGNVSPTDGTPLTERVTYRKMKFSRRELVSEKIDAAINSSVNGHLVVGLSMVGVYQNRVGAGDTLDALGSTRSANRGAGTGQVDLNFAGKPMRDTILFLDLNAGVGPGIDALAGNSAGLNPNYLSGSGHPAVREAWVAIHTPRKDYGLQAGVIDLSGIFDSNLVANDETSQFLTGAFVNSPILAPPANSLGALLRADFSRWNFKIAAQNASPGAAATDVTDDVYSVAELGFRYNFFGDSQWRVWARQQPRGSGQPDQAVGLSMDQRISPKLNGFVRYAKQGYIEAYDSATDTRIALNANDWAASGGFELGNLWAQHAKDRVGLAYGRNRAQNGNAEDFSELYYKTVLTPGFTVSMHGQGIFSRVQGTPATDALPNIFALGLRTQVSY
jgi:hypothetical protein